MCKFIFTTSPPVGDTLLLDFKRSKLNFTDQTTREMKLFFIQFGISSYSLAASDLHRLRLQNYFQPFPCYYVCFQQ